MSDELRAFAQQTKRQLLNGAEVKRGEVLLLPAPEGGGFLLKSRGQTWHRRSLDEAVTAFMSELGNTRTPH